MHQGEMFANLNNGRTYLRNDCTTQANNVAIDGAENPRLAGAAVEVLIWLHVVSNCSQALDVLV